MEWSDKSKYNSFNSYKGLAYYQNYRKIAEWFEGRGNLPPPIECSLDPITKCNLKCYYCNSQRYLRDNPDEVPYGTKLSGEFMRKLVDFLAEWGVKGLCLGGGGESLLNQAAQKLPSYATERGMEVSVVTNGTVMNETLLEQLMHCRWVGISVDAAFAHTYEAVHGVDLMGKVVENTRKLVAKKEETGSKVDIAYKVLVLPENLNQLHQACRLAKEIGADDFHVRPVDLERKDFRMASQLNFNMKRIMKQFEKCHKEETKDFRVYTVMHKYDKKFHVKHDFSKCLAAPLVLQCCTDGNAYVCVDHRLEDRFKLGSYNPPENILAFWGSDEHRALLKAINPSTECSRCTWAEYNRQIEEVVVQDKCCLAFP